MKRKRMRRPGRVKRVEVRNAPERKYNKPAELLKPAPYASESPEVQNAYAKELADAMSALNPAQTKFCELYVETRDPAKSYAMAYPKSAPASSRANGYRLLNQEKIQTYIKLLVREAGIATKLDMEEVMAELTRVAMNNNLDSATKLKALQLIGQSMGQLSDKVEVTTKEFVIDIIDDEED